MGKLQDFAENARKKMSATNSNSVTNKSVLFELLKTDKFTKKEATIQAASNYFEASKIDPKTQNEFDKRVKTMGDAFDTMKSNYNSSEKISGDKLLAGTKWTEPQAGHYIIK